MADAPLTVFTGDIVASARLPAGALDRVMETLAAAADAAAGWRGGKGGARFTRFRGDGWQCLGPGPGQALRAALFLRAHVRALGRGLDTRTSIGIGGGRLPAGGAGLAAAGGAAFEVSGGGLDGMRRSVRLVIGWERPPPCAATTAAVVTLADALSRRWTPRQAAAFRAALTPEAPAQAAIAARLGVTQQTVARHLGSGGDWALREALATLEAVG